MPQNPPSSSSKGPAIEGFALGPFQTNCYIVTAPGTDECWIVDVSFEPEPLIERVRARGLRPTLIVLTHAHIDHIAGLPEARAAFPGVPVLIHADEAAFLTDPELNLSGPHGMPFSTDPADRLLRGGETLTLAGDHWLVIHTPGHSPGGITLWNESLGEALVGDTLFQGSVGRFDFPTSDEAALRRSIKESLYRLPDATIAHPGHGPETTIGVEKRSNPFVRGDR